MKQCTNPKCSNDWWLGNHNFCLECGSPMEEVQKCTCGENLHKSYGFCPGCGKSYNEAIEPKKDFIEGNATENVEIKPKIKKVFNWAMFWKFLRGQ